MEVCGRCIGECGRSPAGIVVARGGRLGSSLAGSHKLHLGYRRPDPGNNHRISFRDGFDKGVTRRLGLLLEAWSIYATLLNKDRSQNVGGFAESG